MFGLPVRKKEHVCRINFHKNVIKIIIDIDKKEKETVNLEFIYRINIATMLMLSCLRWTML